DVLRSCAHVSCICTTDYHYCHNSESLSHKPLDNRWEIEKKGYIKYINTCKVINIYDKYNAHIEKFMWRCLRSTIRDYLRRKDNDEFKKAFDIISSLCNEECVQDAVCKMASVDKISDVFLYFIKNKNYKVVTYLFLLEKLVEEHSASSIRFIKHIFKY
ncbi:MAG: hypothetical protein Q4B70_15475, partial [Lachnospiraceae bacterium]|nr:hypothetical protein [Lachnospiraceae bacterium]